MGISWSFRITQRNPRKKQSLKAEKEKLGIPDWQGRSGKTILCREHHVIIIKDSFEALCFGKAESVSQFSHSVVSDSLWPHESQHARPPCPSPTPGVHSNSCPLSRWCYPAISSSVVPFSSCPQSFPASESFPRSQLFAWGGQSSGVSALPSFLPKNTQDWTPLEWTGWISLQSKQIPLGISNMSRLIIFVFCVN